MKKGNTTYGLFGTTNTKLSGNKTIVKDLKFSDIDYNYLKKDMIIPDYQRELDNEKIEELIDEITNDNYYLLNCTNPIQLASIQLEEKKWVHYIIDGQHRLMAIKKLVEKFPNNYQNFTLHKCENEKEAIKIFSKLIKGQENNYLLSENIFINDFRASKQYMFKEYLIKFYSEHFVTTNQNKWVYSIEKFLIELREKGFFELKKCKNDIKMKDLILKKLKKFSSKINYKTNLENNMNIVYKKEKDILIECNYECMGLKNNNFINYIFTSKEKKIIPTHFWKVSKEKISTNLKDKVWNTYFENQNKKQCPINNCNKYITKHSFSTGHIVSELNKGNTDINNLYPICSNCNSSMGTKNWKDYDIISYTNILNKQESIGI